MSRLPFVVLLLGGVAHADTKLTFEKAIEMALGQNPDAATAKENIAGAESHLDGQKARRLPVLSVGAVAQLYREAYKLPFGMDDMGNPIVFTLHENFVTASNVTITQPLTGLAYLSEVVGAAEHDVARSKSDYDKVKLDIAYRTADAYIRVLEARATADVARQNVADIQSGLDRAVQLRQADVYTDIDVLRFKSAKAAADQQVLKSQTQADEAIATFAVQLGLPEGTAVDISDDLPPTPPALAMDLAASQQRAMTSRPELRSAAERVAAAKATEKSAYWMYFPDIRAVGVYEHNSGTQPFAEENAEYVGLRLSWNVWDWGQVRAQKAEAEHAETRAKLDAGQLADQVKLDVRRHWLDAKTAFDSLDVAKVQQQAADEAYRLQKVKFDAAAATTTDVLDAEIDAARARLTSTVARYDYYLSLVGLARSVGDVPKP